MTRPAEWVRPAAFAAASWLLLSGIAPADSYHPPPAGTGHLKSDAIVQFVEDVGHVSVIEIDGNYDRDDGGVFNVAPRRAVAEALFGHHADEYDFLFVFSSFEFDTGSALAFHVGVRNAVEGIGLPIYDQSELWGSAGRLQGYVDMAALSRYVTNPTDPEFDQVLTVLGHEMMHQWCCRVDFEREGEARSDALLGRGGSHWSFLLDSTASLMYGHDWRDNGDGSFTALEALKFYGPLDLYLAGFYQPSQVADTLLIDNDTVDAGQLSQPNVTITGVATTVAVSDLVRAEGPRIPAAGDAQRNFRAGFIYLIPAGGPIYSSHLAAIEEIRLAFLTRFAILTGGEGFLEIYPVGFPEGETGEPEPVDGGPVRPDADVADGLAWLRSRQTAEGFWEDRPGTRLRDTQVAFETLLALDPAFTGGAAAAAWLSAREEVTNDYLARLARALEAAGESGAARRITLLERQGSDGGWGVTAGFESDPLDTALVLLALAGHLDAGTPQVSAALAYLDSARQAAGGWGGAGGGPGRSTVTTVVLEAMAAFGDAGGRAEAMAWLAARQNVADGGFGDSPSSIHDTASVLSTLLALDATDLIDRPLAEAYLATRQTVDGSWAGSVYATALAVEALRATARPNLLFAAPLAAAPAQPQDGEQVTLTLVVANGGGVATAGLVDVFDGDPSAGGTAIASGIEVPFLLPNQSVTLTVGWDTADLPGAHTLVAVLDPANAIDESSETDNRSSLEITVDPPPLGPELALAAEDLTVVPEMPVELPSTLSFFAVVRNVGLTGVDDVRVVVWEGEPETGTLIHDSRIAVPARSGTMVNFTHQLALPAAVYTAQVDPDDEVAEDDEANNSSSLEVQTLPTFDLEVRPEDIVLTSADTLPGADISWDVTLRNRGTRDLPRNVTVRYLVTDGGANTIELLSESLFFAAGQETVRPVTWRATLEGALQLVVEIDGDGLLETDLTNNQAAYGFTVGTFDVPNLVVRHENLSFDPDPGREGKALDISILVENTGGTAAADFDLLAYDGNPDDGGTQVAGPVNVASLAVGESQLVTLTWPSVAGAADRFVFVEVDPDDRVVEVTEDDNTTFEELVVHSLPDFVLSPAALQLTPGFPEPGAEVTLTVTVTNLGEQSADGVRVRLYDGDPAAGGQMVASDQVIPVVPGSGVAAASFTWTLATTGVLSLYAVADPDDEIDEQSTLNNAAERAFAVQESGFFVSERYISPDGDGVQDSSRLFFRLEQPADVVLEIFDSRERLVRTLGTMTGVAEGDVEWDGRDDRGRLARDGRHRLQVTEVATGAALGEAYVIVDTNRTPLLRAAGTELESFVNLTCLLPELSEGQVTADEQWFYGVATDGDGTGYPPGVYRVSLDDFRVSEVFADYAEYPFYLEVAADGSKVSWVSRTRFPNPLRFFLWIADGDGGNRTQIGATTTDSSRSPLGFDGDSSHLIYVDQGDVFKLPVDDLTSPQVLFTDYAPYRRLSPDGRTLLVGAASEYDDSGELNLIDLDSGALTQLANLGWAAKAAWSADGSRIVVVTAIGLEVYDRGGNLLTSVPPPDPDLPPDFEDFGFGPGSYGKIAWSSISNQIAVSLEYDNGPACEGGGVSATQLVLVDFDTGEVTAVAWSEPVLTCCCIQAISTWDGEQWAERGRLAAGEAGGFDLSPYLPDADGELKVRVTEVGEETSALDRITLLADGRPYTPLQASVPGSDLDCADKLRRRDGDSQALDGDTLELRFAPGLGGSLRLALDHSRPPAKAAQDLLGYLGEVHWAPADEALLLPAFTWGGTGAWAVFLGDGDGELTCDDGDGGDGDCVDDPDNVWLRFLEGFPRGDELFFAPSGRLMIFDSTRDSDDSDSVCHDLGFDDHFLMRSFMNLTADLRIRRSVDPTNVLLEGSAADLGLRDFRLEYAPLSSPESWAPVAPPSSRLVLDELFQTWVPPAPGTWLVRLTVEDLAGNTRSTIKRVSAADFPEITDVWLTPELFSPNSDGLIDQTVIHFEAQVPVHVEIQVFDGAGRLAALIEQDAPAAGEYNVVWDGRGIDGLVVPDGSYNVRLRGYEMVVEVDTTPVAVSIGLSEPYRVKETPLGPVPVVDPVFSYSIVNPREEELEIQEELVERGQGAFPAQWLLVPEINADDRGRVLTFSEYDNARYRALVRDDAGNLSVNTSDLALEKLMLLNLGDHEVLPGGDFAALEGLDTPGLLGLIYHQDGSQSSVTHVTDSGVVRLRLAETIAAEIETVYVQYRLGDDDPWIDVAVGSFFDAGSTQPVGTPPNLFEFVWEVSDQTASSRQVRIAADDADGNRFLSSAFILVHTTDSGCPEITFYGLLRSLGEDFPPFANPECYDRDQLLSDLIEMLAASGLDPLLDQVLWGVETVPDVLADATLLLRSSDDTAYAVWTDVALVDVRDGIFIFTPEPPLTPCSRYLYRLSGETQPQLDPATGTIASRVVDDEGQVVVRCLDISLDSEVRQASSCNAPPPAEVDVFLAGHDLTGDDALAELTLVRRLAGGGEEVLFTAQPPVSGLRYQLVLDLDDYDQGVEELEARLINLDGDFDAREVDFVVDKTPPELTVDFPGEGAVVCGFDGAVEILATVFEATPSSSDEDTVPRFGDFTEDRVYGGPLPRPRPTTRFSLPAIDCGAPPCHPAASLEATGPDRFEFSGLLDQVGGFEGPVTYGVEVWDQGGYRTCTERGFTIDAFVPAVPFTVDYRFFSPDDDGIQDLVQIDYQVTETLRLDVELVPAVLDPFLGCVASGPVVRTLLSDQTVIEDGRLYWDGRDDGGAVVPDGHYLLLLRDRDACGNQNLSSECAFVDVVPPQVEILFPRLTDTDLSVIVPVTYSRSGQHFLQLSFGESHDPTSWQTLPHCHESQSNPCVTNWNTFGLAGDYTLRLEAVDLAGNRSEVREPITLPVKADLITYFDALPELFSPNGDGRRETAALRFGLLEEADVELTVETEGGTEIAVVAVERLAGGGWIRPWDGRRADDQPAADGRYKALLEAILASDPNFIQTAEVTFDLDRTPPVIDLTRPTAGGFIPGTGSAEGSITDPRLTYYNIALAADTGAPPVFTEIGSGEASVTGGALAALGELGDGPYFLRARAGDAAEIESELSFSFTVDNTPPEVEITAPAPAIVVGAVQGPTLIFGMASDDHLSAWALELGAGDEPDTWSELVAGGEAGPAEDLLLAWDPAAVPDGLYTLRLMAEDKAGNQAEARQLIVVDNTPPAVAITAPADGFVTEPTSIEGSAGDLHFVDYRVQIADTASGAPSDWIEIAFSTQPVAAGLLADWSTLPAGGPWAVRLIAVDQPGNTAQARVDVVVDTSPPASPLVLTAVVENDRDARLDWNDNSEPDLAGYRVYRGGQLITGELVPDSTYLDPALQEGTYLYRVTAVDNAGLESEPSNDAEVEIDVTPPQASISTPADGARVSGVVEVEGTAFSQDFHQYRLYAERLDPPAARQLLRVSPVPIQADLLGQWTTISLPEESQFRLLLEAEDLAGNVASSEVTVTVDNLPPAAPIGLVADPSGVDDVSVTWSAGGEPDLFGYLLFRDGRIANADGPVVGDLTPYVLTATSYLDQHLPDGTYTYVVHAVDQAGNLSDPSNQDDATVETGPPRAVITTPEDGEDFETDLFIEAESEDTDVADVQFQYRPRGTSTWIDLEAPVLALPWAVILDPLALGLAFGDFDLRAVATDTSDLTDPSPPSIRVTYADLTPPAVVLSIGTMVDGGEVTVTWAANTADADLDGYLVFRRREFGSRLRITPAPIPDTTLLDPGLADDRYFYDVAAVDLEGNLSALSEEVEARVFTPLLELPYTPTRDLATVLEGSGEPEHTVTADLTSPSGSSTLPPVASDEAGEFSLPLPLERGANTVTVSMEDADGNLSKTAAVTVTSGAAPSRPQGLDATVSGFDVDLTWDPNPEPDILGYRVLRNGLPVIADVEVADYDSFDASSYVSSSYAPWRAFDGSTSTAWLPYGGAGEWLEAGWPGQRLVSSVRVQWYQPFANYAARDYRIQAWNTAGWVTVAEVTGNAEAINDLVLSQVYRTDRLRLLVDAPLNTTSSRPIRVAEMDVWVTPLVPETPTAYTDVAPDGVHFYTLTAYNDFGFESLPSNPTSPVEVGDVVPPEPVVLSAVVVDDWDVELTWTPSADAARYDLYRDGAKIAEHFDLGSLLYLDPSLANGTYAFLARAIDAVGNASEPSNEEQVTIDVEPPGIPIDLQVTAVAAGGALDTAWQPGPGPAPFGYVLWRSLVAGGPYQEVTTTAATAYHDDGLTNGVEYFYVVSAFDQAGNAGGESNEASGTPQNTLPVEVPVIHFPTVSGRVFFTDRDTADIAGEGEPDADVSLSRNGGATADGHTLASTEVDFSGFYADGYLRPSRDGRYLWEDDYDYHTLYDFETEEEQSFDHLGEGVAHWTAGSRRLVFTRYEGVTESELLFINVEDGSTELITTVEYAEVAVPSADGRTLAVLAERGPQAGLWLYDLVTGVWTLLIDQAGDFGSIREESLAWAPDGSRLAWARYDDDADGYQLEAMLPSSGTVQLIDGELSERRFDWSEDGGQLLFSSDRDGGGIWRYDFAGDSAVLMVDNDDAREGHLSPSGGAIAYLQYGVFPFGSVTRVLDLASGDTETLLSGPDFWDLDWTAGGHLFVSDDGEPLRLARAGRFEFRGVSLEPGDNQMVATIRGADSEPIVISTTGGGLPDWAVELTVVPAALLSGSPVRATATLSNTGTQPAPQAGFSMAILGPGGFLLDLADGESVGPLAAGDSLTVVRELDLTADPGEYTFVAAVDPLGEVAEASEANNLAQAAIHVVEGGVPALAVATDRPFYQSDDNVEATIELLGGGDEFTGQLLLAVEDDAGFLVHSLGSRPVVGLGLGDVQVATADWNTGATFAGPYRVRATLVDDLGQDAVEGFAPFTIFGDSELSSTVTTGATTYPVGATVTLVGSFAYDAGNQPLTGAEMVLRVVDGGGTARAEWQLALGTLLPGAAGSISRSWPGATPAGGYTAVFEVRRGGEVLTAAESGFTITQGDVQLGGQLTLPVVDPEVGEDLDVDWQVEQLSGPALAQALVRISIVDPGSQAVLASEQLTADLGPATGSLVFATGGLSLGTYLVVLEGAQSLTSPLWLILDTESFGAVDRTPPVVDVLTPPAGGFLGADLAAVTSARDLLSGVEAVELAVDGGGWLPAFHLVGDQYRRQLSGLTEGVHSLGARAMDFAGNLGSSDPVSFIVDLTPPEILITGVVDGETYDQPVTPVIEIVELYPASQSITLNGAAFVSGTEVSAAGEYQLVVLAEDQAGNSAQAVVGFTVEQPLPVLAATKIDLLAADNDGDGVAGPGDELRYEITVDNSGEAAATGVTLSDAVPAFTTLVPGSVMTSAGSVTGQDPVVVAVGELAASSTVAVSFSVEIDAALPLGVDQLENQGVVTSDQLTAVLTDDPALGGAGDPTRTAVTAAPILVAEKVATSAVDADGDGQVSPGDTLEYAVTLRNVGNTSATGVTLVDPVPAFTSMLAGSVVASAGSILGEDPVVVDFGEVAAAVVVEVRFRVVIDAALPAGVDEIVGQGTVSSTELGDLLTDDPGVGGVADVTVTPVVAVPVLTAEKTDLLFADGDGDGVASAGDELLYVINVGNSGNIAATAIVLSDPIPAGTLIVPGTLQTSHGVVTAEDPVVVSLGELAADETAELSFRVRIDDPLPDGVVEVVNQGTVSSAELPDLATDDPQAPGLDDPTVTVLAFPALTATKTASLAGDGDGNGIPSPGDELLFQMVISNAGDGAAGGVVLDDQIPQFTELVAGSVTTTAGLVLSEDPLQVAVGSLAPGAAVTVGLRVRVDNPLPPEVDQVVNQGVVSSAGGAPVLTDDPAIGGGSDPTIVVVTARPALVAEKVDALAIDNDGNGEVSPGDVLEYTVTLLNVGNTAATLVTLTDAIPANTSVVAGSVTTTAGTVSSEDPVVVAVGRQEVAGVVVVTFRVTLDSPLPAGVDQIVNQGAVTSGELPAVLTDDPDLPGAGNPTITELLFPDLGAVKTAVLSSDADGDGIPSPGDELLYQMVISNAGAGAAAGVVLDDQIPQFTELVAGSVTTTAGLVLSEDPVQVEVGSLAPGAAVTVGLEVRVDNPLPPEVDEVVNQGVVSSAGGAPVLTDDPAIGGGSDPTIVVVTARPALVAEKVDALAIDNDGNGEVSPGDVLEYTVTLLNVGNTAATLVTLTDAIPANTSVVAGSVTTTAGTVSSEDPVIVVVGQQDVAGLVTVTFRVTLDSPWPVGVGEVANQGTVTSGELPAILTDDPDLPGTEDPTVTELLFPDLGAVKTAVLSDDADGDGIPSPGDELLYQMVISNAGAGTAADVVLDDQIPQFTELVAGSVTTTAGLVLSEDPVQVEIGSLASGAAVTVDFRVRVDNPLPPEVNQVVNQGVVSSAGGMLVLTDDPDLPGAEDPTVTAVTAAPVVSATKVDSLWEDAGGDGQASPGDVLRYQIDLANDGNVAATAVILEDMIPDYTDYQPGSLETSQGTIVSEDPVVVDLGDLSAAATARVLFRVRISDPLPAEVEEISNQGTVSSTGQPDLPTDDPDTPELGDATRTPVTAALPMLSISDVTVTEGEPEAVFTVTLTGVQSQTVTVRVDTRDGTATAGSDYQTVSTILEFQPGPGATSRTVSVPIIDDGEAEDPEIFFVDLSDAINAELDNATAGATIEDDDEPAVALTAVKWDTLVVDSGGDGWASPGDQLEYTLMLSNAGPGIAGGVELVDEIPDWTYLVPGSIVISAGTVITEDPLRVELGDLAAGETFEAIFQVLIDDGIPPSVGLISNQGVFTSRQTPAVLTDDPDTPEPDDPTMTEVRGLPVIEIPSAGGPGLAVLAGLLAISALVTLRRRRLSERLNR